MTNLFHTQLHLFLYFFTYPSVFNHTTRLGTVWRNFKSSSKHGSKLIASISFSLLIFLVKDILYRVQNRHELGSEFFQVKNISHLDFGRAWATAALMTRSPSEP